MNSSFVKPAELRIHNNISLWQTLIVPHQTKFFSISHAPFKDPCSVHSSQSVALSLWQFGIVLFSSWLLEIGLSLVPLHPSAMGGLVNLFPNPSSRNLSIPRVLICPSLPKESHKSQQSTPPSVFNCRVLGSGRICNMAISFAWNHRRYDFIESNLRFSLKDKYFVSMLFFFSPGVSIKKNSSQPIMLQADKDKVWNIRITWLMFKLFC